MTEASLESMDRVVEILTRAASSGGEERAGLLARASSECLRALELDGLDSADHAWFEAKFDLCQAAPAAVPKGVG